MASACGAPRRKGQMKHIRSPAPDLSTTLLPRPYTTRRFRAGDLVRVREEGSAVRWRKPHLRTPGYIFGVVGMVERECQVGEAR